MVQPSLFRLQLTAEFLRVSRYQSRKSLCPPDQIQFVFLALAQPPLGITVRPELALSDVFKTGDFHVDSKHLSFRGSR
jgi:hypothetical protein